MRFTIDLFLPQNPVTHVSHFTLSKQVDERRRLDLLLFQILSNWHIFHSPLIIVLWFIVTRLQRASCSPRVLICNKDRLYFLDL